MTNDGEFRGTTKQAIRNLEDEVKDLKKEVQGLSGRINVLFILFTIAVIERLPNLLQFATTLSAKIR